MNLLPADFQERWCSLLAQTKFIVWHDWVETPPPPKPPKKGTFSAPPVQSLDASRFIMVTSFTNSDGVAVEGARLRIVLPTRRLDSDMTCTVECLDWRRSYTCITRIDANPTSPHTNKHWRRFDVPPTVAGTHIHPFGLNSKLGTAAFEPPENLPVAHPLPDDIRSFRDFLRSVGKEFNISDLPSIPSPPWTEGLF